MKYRDHPLVVVSACALMVCAAFWFFKETMLFSIVEEEQVRRHVQQQITDTTILTVGQNPLCQAEVKLSTWDKMNQLEIYRWVIACEDKLASEVRP